MLSRAAVLAETHPGSQGLSQAGVIPPPWDPDVPVCVVPGGLAVSGIAEAGVLTVGVNASVRRAWKHVTGQ